MKTIILAGGYGTRLAEETHRIPKPLVEIGGRPILWHIMKIYAHYGYDDFLVACGYKGEMIKAYFHNYFIHYNDYFVDLKNGNREVIRSNGDDWHIGVIDTGLDTQTGGRILRLRSLIGDAPFMLTYGDGVGTVDIGKLVAFHRSHGRLATVTAVHPPARFGALSLEGDQVCRFAEKPQTGEGWINGGFFVLEPEVFDYLDGDETVFEREALERLAADRQLMAYRHYGFWHPMDTLRDKRLLDSLWKNGDAPWKVFSDSKSPISQPTSVTG